MKRFPTTGRLDFWQRTRAPRRRLAMFAAFLGFVFASSPSGNAQSKPQEYQVQAAYLYNFGKFVDWPAASPKDGPFAICVLGRDPFREVLDSTIAGEKIGNQQLIAKRIAGSRDAKDCRILFISSSEAGRIKDILADLDKSDALTVSDMPDFTSAGGMIQFVVRENKVRFEVNLGAAKTAGLTLSSQLLKVATDVRNGSRVEKTNQ